MNENKFSPKRMKRILLISLTMVVYSVIIACYKHYMIDRILILLLIHTVFLPFLTAVIELGRLKGDIHGYKMSDLSMLAGAFAAALACYTVFLFLPAYTAPVMIPAIILAAAGNEMVGMLGGIYFNTLLSIAAAGSFEEYAAYTLLTICGCMMTLILSRKNMKIYGSMIIFAMSMVIPCIFYYIGTFEMKYERYLYILGGSLAGVVTATLFFDPIYFRAGKERAKNLKDIIAEKYPLVQEVKNYSEMDYAHAVKVSNIAYECAKQIGADEMVAAAAGFYYRIGKLEGEPFIENGVSLARMNCFPEEVIRILSEYNGAEERISTIESALVHMVDLLVAKFELLDKETLKGSWNHDIVIYQTLNEKSAEGIYDDSGLGMNQFLKIREYLAKGVDLF